MGEPLAHSEVFLQPGELYFGDGKTRIRTLLGSCVSVTLWHPRAKVGGMCHYMMPTRPGRQDERQQAPGLDGRYADEALALLVEHIQVRGLTPQKFQAKLFGGGRQFQTQGRDGVFDVPERNVQAGIDLLEALGIPVLATHLGGSGHRQVLLDLWSGQVWMRHSGSGVARTGTGG
jgi:chemotaxis protein CheD